MKLLNGAELASYIKERQLREIRSLKQSKNIFPKLAIIRTNPDPIVDTYMRLKQSYGEDIGIEVDIHTIGQEDALQTIQKLNEDPSIHGIIVQIPLPDVSKTTEVLNAVVKNKDVDGLAEVSDFDPATPVAINWLLAGYNINLPGTNMLIIGNGRLVGKPLSKIWRSSGLNPTVVDSRVENLAELAIEADILICATGVSGLVNASMIKDGAVIVDAGVATDNNGLVGDVAPDVRDLKNIKITPEKGGVGPLTVCALFDNVLKSARS